MSDTLEALEAAVALVCGGFLFIMFGSALQATPILDLSLWGLVLVVVGIVAGIAVIASVIVGFLGRAHEFP